MQLLIGHGQVPTIMPEASFVYGFFSKITVLINALQEYRRVTRQCGNAKTLWDFI